MKAMSFEWYVYLRQKVCNWIIATRLKQYVYVREFVLIKKSASTVLQSEANISMAAQQTEKILYRADTRIRILRYFFGEKKKRTIQNEFTIQNIWSALVVTILWRNRNFIKLKYTYIEIQNRKQNLLKDDRK